MSTAPIIDRDPGDETRPVSRSWRATYAYEQDLATSDNGWLKFRDFIGPDSFLDAVTVAEERREDDERLLNVTELTGSNINRP